MNGNNNDNSNNKLKNKNIKDISDNIFYFNNKNLHFLKNTPLLLCNGNNRERAIERDKEKTLKSITNNHFMKNRERTFPYNLRNSLDKTPTRSKRELPINNLNSIIEEINLEYNNINKQPKSPFFIKSPSEIKQILPLPIVSQKRKAINIKVSINCLQDLIDLCDKYPLSYEFEYNINMEAIHNIRHPITKLNNMIGMKNLKESIVDQILYFVQYFHVDSNDFMHTVIYGPPGTGKTEISKLLGEIFSNLGVLKKKKWKKVTRADLIAGYLGQTALKTKNVIKDSLGGVLFIDEAYALGNSEKRDSFAKECIDTLCEALSDHKENLMVIIAGYEKELKNCFFEYNKGLDSRFTWRFKTDNYSHKELNKIFIKKVNEINWSFKNPIKDSWYENKMKYFTYFGRDMETLLAKVKIAHSKRVFCLDASQKKIITLEDMNKGFDIFFNNDEVKNRDNADFYNSMYC
jgi:ATP-dependent 26S proteasome regulatory subunit